MWKRTAPLVLAVAVSLGIVHGKPPPGQVISKVQIRQAITIFRRDPTGAQGQMTRPLILEFAENSPDAEIVLGEKLLPWMTDKQLRGDDGAYLLTAYCAGAIDCQLAGGKAHGAALTAACEQVIATYRQLQKKEPGLKAPGVEKLIELQRQGILAKYVQEADQSQGANGKKRG